MNKATNVKKQILASQIAYKRTQNNEVQLEKALAKFFNKLKKEVLNALDDYWKDYQMLQGHIDLICAPVHEAHKEYYELLALYIKREYRLGSAEAKRLVKLANSKQRVASKSMRMPVRAIIKKDNDLFGTLPSAEERLLNRTFTASERTLSRVDSQINQIITDGYRSGKGINDVANSLNQRFDQLTSWESKRIARTEIHNSHNTAVMDTYQELGVEYTMWIAAEDERTRDSHLEINGEIIPMGGTYSNGLKYPGDTDGDIEEWINCRCSNAPFVIPYGYMAPSFSPFREDDLVKVETKDPQQIIDEMNKPTEEENWVNKYSVEENSTFNRYTLENGTQITVDHETNLTFEMLQDHLNNLPSDAKLSSENLTKIEIKATNNRLVNGQFNIKTKTLTIYDNNQTVGKKLDTLNHELTHAKDGANSKYLKLSSIEEYEKIVTEKPKLGYEYQLLWMSQNVTPVYVHNSLAPAQIVHIKQLLKLIDGYESAYSLEVLASVAYVRREHPGIGVGDTIHEIQNWSARKKNLFKQEHIEAAFQHVIVCKGLEPVVLTGKEEPFCSILEVSLSVVDVTQDVV